MTYRLFGKNWQFGSLYLLSVYGCVRYKTNVEEGEKGGTNDNFYVKIKD